MRLERAAADEHAGLAHEDVRRSAARRTAVARWVAAAAARAPQPVDAVD